MIKYFRLSLADYSFADYFQFVAGRADPIRGPLFNRQLKIGNRKCHYSSSVNVTFSTSRKFNSTGVERPKIVTVTLSVDFSSFTSSTLPVKLWNGPDLMRTVSPAAYENFGFGFSSAAACWF